MNRICIACRKSELLSDHGNARYCRECRGMVSRLQRRTGALVFRAVLTGALRSPKSFACADCGKAARYYDHRDYRHPLAVEAVCGSCNTKRGPVRWDLAA